MSHPQTPAPSSLVTLGGTRMALVGRARVYVCGITPYDTTHIGHAATFVWSDVAVRFLRSLGIHVEVARNITDVDDVLVEEGRRQGAPWRSIAARSTYRFEDDIARLGVLTPTYEPKAHDHIDDVIALAGALLDLGRAYEHNGTVWFRSEGVAEAAALSRQEALARVAEHGGHGPAGAEDPLDAPLWIRSAEGEPAWPSPWGDGRPGWHAECSAMALATLGVGLDLHCGGADLAFPHHAFEAAQVEAALGVRPFSRAWLRAGTVLHDGAKMAKSTGNLVFVDDVLGRHPSAALRLAIVNRRWWDTWEFNEELVTAAAAQLAALRQAGARVGDEAVEPAAVAAVADDLDVPTAMSVALDRGGATAAYLIDVLGLHHYQPVQRTTVVPSR